MAASEATTIEVDGRELRVSSGSRGIFPATDRTPELTKLDVVKYYLSVGDGIMRALRERPVTLDRWPKGEHEDTAVATRENTKGADAFFQKRIPRGATEDVETARIAFPSGRFSDEGCRRKLAVVGLCSQIATIHFPPWPVRREDVDHPV